MWTRHQERWKREARSEGACPIKPYPLREDGSVCVLSRETLWYLGVSRRDWNMDMDMDGERVVGSPRAEGGGVQTRDKDSEGRERHVKYMHRRDLVT